ncbi:hypothetical protein GQX74_003341 [Glossina fuscipes]|nr:hypothetical protein GQX74_003341 [Glossina fuscipes]
MAKPRFKETHFNEYQLIVLEYLRNNHTPFGGTFKDRLINSRVCSSVYEQFKRCACDTHIITSYTDNSVAGLAIMPSWFSTLFNCWAFKPPTPAFAGPPRPLLFVLLLLFVALQPPLNSEGDDAMEHICGFSTSPPSSSASLSSSSSSLSSSLSSSPSPSTATTSSSSQYNNTNEKQYFLDY